MQGTSAPPARSPHRLRRPASPSRGPCAHRPPKVSQRASFKRKNRPTLAPPADSEKCGELRSDSSTSHAMRGVDVPRQTCAARATYTMSLVCKPRRAARVKARVSRTAAAVTSSACRRSMQRRPPGMATATLAPPPSGPVVASTSSRAAPLPSACSRELGGQHRGAECGAARRPPRRQRLSNLALVQSRCSAIIS